MTITESSYCQFHYILNTESSLSFQLLAQTRKLQKEFDGIIMAHTEALAESKKEMTKDFDTMRKEVNNNIDTIKNEMTTNYELVKNEMDLKFSQLKHDVHFSIADSKTEMNEILGGKTVQLSTKFGFDMKSFESK